MFIQENEEKGGRFITVSGGKIKMKVDEGTTGAKMRVNLKGDQVWEMSYKGITNCQLVGVRVEEGNYGNQIILDLKDSEQILHLAVKEESSYGRAIYSLFQNIDPKVKLDIMPYDFVNNEGKKFVGFSFNQGGKKVEKSLPEGTPEVQAKEISGKWVYNQIQQAERGEFLRAKLLAWAKSFGLDPKDLGEAVDNTPLQPEEIKELKSLKKANKKVEVEEGSMDDFFNE